MIESQIGEAYALASQYGIEEIVLAEMQRVNGDQEVRVSFFLLVATWSTVVTVFCNRGANNGDWSSANSSPGS